MSPERNEKADYDRLLSAKLSSIVNVMESYLKDFNTAEFSRY